MVFIFKLGNLPITLRLLVLVIFLVLISKASPSHCRDGLPSILCSKLWSAAYALIICNLCVNRSLYELTFAAYALTNSVNQQYFFLPSALALLPNRIIAYQLHINLSLYKLTARIVTTKYSPWRKNVNFYCLLG